MDGSLASTYTLIYAFLTKNSHTKAAQAVKKAAKEVVILKDDIDIEGPQLDQIIAQWKSFIAPSESTSESDSESSSSESSSSSSSGSLSNRQSKKVTKGIKKKASLSLSPSSSSSSSESSSSSSDSESTSNPPIKTSAMESKVSTPLAKSPSSESSSSSSNSDSESDDESESRNPKPSTQKQNLEKKIKSNTDQKPKVERDSSRTLSSGNASGSGSDPESDDENEGNEPLISPKQESLALTDSTSEAGTPKAQVEDEVQVTKKRRMDMSGTAAITATTITVRPEETRAVSTGRIKGSNARPGRQANERFQRVDPTKVEPIMDNRYVAKVAPTGDYGQRAHEALIVTRGQGFRKEKNKKKKGSYRGGEITLESHSFKFA